MIRILTYSCRDFGKHKICVGNVYNLSLITQIISIEKIEVIARVRHHIEGRMVIHWMREGDWSRILQIKLTKILISLLNNKQN